MRDYASGLNYALDTGYCQSRSQCGYSMRAAEGLRCPLCRSNEHIPIVYGFPSEAIQQAVQKGEIELGGCIVRENPPSRHCKNCGHYFSFE